MKNGSALSSVAKLLTAVMLAAPLQGCLISTGNVKLDNSLSSAFSGLTGSGKKEWPFIPTDGEIQKSKFADGVMRQAMTQNSVSVGYSASQAAELRSLQGQFSSFMESAPNMDQWTVAQANQYSSLVSKISQLVDPVLTASENAGSSSSSAFLAKVKRNGGVVSANTVYVPAHSLVQVGIATNCADEGMERPSSSTGLPNNRLVDAAFAQLTPSELAPHLRNIQNAFATGTSGQNDYVADSLIWDMTQADVFTSRNRTMFRSINQAKLDKISPGLYADYNRVNKAMATAGGQTYTDNIASYPATREFMKPSSQYASASASATAKARAENTASNQLTPDVYYHIHNESFIAKIAFFNAGDQDFKVDLSRYALVNDGTVDQQRLVAMGLSKSGKKNAIGDAKTVSADIDSVTLAKMVAMDVTRYSISKGAEELHELGKNPAFLAHQSGLIKQMGSSLMKKFFRAAPLASGVIAANEAYTGVDFVSGRNMTGIERGLAALEATPTPGATAEKLAAKLNWGKVASAIHTYGDTVRGSIYWDAAGYGLESYKQTLGSTGDYLSGQWSNAAIQSEAQKALIFINNSGSAIDKMIASYGS